MDMALIQVSGAGAYALSLTVIVAAIYLAVVRFMDLNEKEPLWAVGMIFFFGAVAGLVLPLIVSSTVLELNTFYGPLAEELAMFLALVVGMVALGMVARSRGWSEVSGLMDGIVYGTAVGFGFATGTEFFRELSFSAAVTPGEVGPLAVLWSTALTGLADGLFGGIMGAGFGAAVGARSAFQRFAYPVVGLAGAILAHIGYVVLSQGNSLGGSEALIRTWIALLLPLIFIAAVIAIALGRENRAIREELRGEAGSGAVTEDELRVLQSSAGRRSQYLSAFMKGDFDRWLTLKELHNRQVQLALAKHRLRGETDPGRRAEIEGEVERLRASVLEMKREPDSAVNSTGAGKVGA